MELSRKIVTNRKKEQVFFQNKCFSPHLYFFLISNFSGLVPYDRRKWWMKKLIATAIIPRIPTASILSCQMRLATQTASPVRTASPAGSRGPPASAVRSSPRGARWCERLREIVFHRCFIMISRSIVVCWSLLRQYIYMFHGSNLDKNSLPLRQYLYDGCNCYLRFIKPICWLGNQNIL